jgi:hypothetical protein
VLYQLSYRATADDLSAALRGLRGRFSARSTRPNVQLF